MIRDAKYSDILAITRFLLERHSKTHYAASGRADMDVDEVKRLLGQGIGRHGHKNLGACWVQVVEYDDNIDGLMYATLHRLHAVYDKLFATELFWLTNDHAKVGDAQMLLQNMLRWAQKSPHVIEVQSGQTSVIGGLPEEHRKILKKLGMQDYGTIHRLELSEQEARLWVA